MTQLTCRQHVTAIVLWGHHGCGECLTVAVSMCCVRKQGHKSFPTHVFQGGFPGGAISAQSLLFPTGTDDPHREQIIPRNAVSASRVG